MVVGAGRRDTPDALSGSRHDQRPGALPHGATSAGQAGRKHGAEQQRLLDAQHHDSSGADVPGGRASPGAAAHAWLSHHRRITTTGLVSLARIFERVDEALLPAVYLYVGCAFGATPTQLGGITFARALVQAVSSPLGGLAGHYLNRVHVIALSAYLWAACTAAFAFVNTVEAAMALWAINGLGLACMVPNGQSLVADYYPAHQRGKAFGWLLGVGNFGAMLATLFATNMGGRQLLGMAGWRLAFLCIAVFSVLVGAAMQLFAADPRLADRSAWLAPRGRLQVDRHLGGRAAGQQAASPPPKERGLPAEVWSVVTTPSFLVVVLQGIVGSVPGSAFAFSTLWFQLRGFSDASTSALLAALAGSSAAGALLGGAVGDWAAGASPDHGRVAAAQISVGAGLPLTLLWFHVLPTAPGMAAYASFGALFVAWGMLTSWAATACNNPIFAEIVPAKLRSLIYAFDRSLEGSLAAMAAPLVGLLAERVFGFTPGGVATGADCTSLDGSAPQHQADPPRAQALGRALEVMMFAPWALCVLFYSALHWTYKRDKARGTADALVDAHGEARGAAYERLGLGEEGGEAGVELVGGRWGGAPQARPADGVLSGPRLLLPTEEF